MPVPSEPGGDRKPAAAGANRRGWWKLALAAGLVVAGVLIAWQAGLFDLIRMENLERLDRWFDGLGAWAPLIFILVWVAACVFFLPGLPLTVLGALLFGPVLGTVYSSVGSTLGATVAFLIGRHGARSMVEKLVERNEILRRIDAGVERQGWRMLMLTRLVPIFPFNAQNFVYGLTRISLPTYVTVSLLCMLPATLAFNFMAGSVRGGDSVRFLLYLSLGAVVFVLVSLAPGWLRKGQGRWGV